MQALLHCRICVKTAFAIALIVCWFGFAQGQQFRSPQPSANDPILVRPQVYSLNQQSQNPTHNQPILQDNGQRVFPQNIDNSSSMPPVASSMAPTTTPVPTSAVQPASWTSGASETVPTIAKTRPPLELRSSSKGTASNLDKPKSTWGATLSMFFSLAVVISFFLLVVWLVKKSQPHSFVKLPGDVVQVMGRTPMAPRQQMYVVRFGSKLLLISHQPGQTQTLGEITDADEVQRLAGLCEANQPGSISNSFRDVLKQVALGKPEPEPRTTSRLAKR